jgi:hypothetical protein
MDFPNLLCINTDRESSKKYILPGRIYIFELPNLNIIIRARCGFKAIKAADMKILECIEKDKEKEEYKNHWFSYEFDKYDTIYFTSYNKKEPCNVYMFT